MAAISLQKPSLSNTTHIPRKQIELDLPQLPMLKIHDWNSSCEQIAAYFRRLLEEIQHRINQKDASSCLVLINLPSVFDLADHFDCSELDILEALTLLKKQAYAYNIPSIDGRITLLDPLRRQPANIQSSQWKTLSQNLFKHLQSLKYCSRMPLGPMSWI